MPGKAIVSCLGVRKRRIGIVSLSNAVAASGTHNAMLGLRDYLDRKAGWVDNVMGYRI